MRCPSRTSLPGRSTVAIVLLLGLPLAQAQDRSGREVVESVCASCHATGAGGAPKIGDQAAWIPRMKRGMDVTVRSAIRGHGNMPARGGMASLTDAEVRSAITYMWNPTPAPGPAPAK
jgi:cytochrome c5